MSARDMIVAVGGAVAVVAILWVFRDDLVPGLAAAVIAGVSAPLAIIDFNEHRLPNRIVVPLAGFATAAVIVLGFVEDDLGRAVTSLLIGAAVFVVLFALGLAGGIGMGDVKFSLPLATVLAWFGSESLVLAFFVMVLSAGLYTCGALIRARSLKLQIPFGPFMAIGFVAGALVAAS